MDLTYVKQYIRHRAKAFGGFFASSLTTALIKALEKTFDFDLGADTEALIVGTVTAQVVFWLSNGPKEGSA